MKAGRILRNSLLVLGGRGISAVATLVWAFFLARYLGRADYGRYGYAYAFVGLFQMLSSFGLNQIVSRESARDLKSTGRYLGHALRLKVVLTLAVFSVIVVISQMSDDPVLRSVVPICAAENLIRVFFNVNLAVIRAHQRMEYDLLISAVDSIVALLGVLFVVRFDLGIRAVFWAFLLASVTQAVTGTIVTWVKLARPNMQRIPGMHKALLKDAWPIGIALETGLVYKRQGIVLLKQWHSLGVVGVFSACSRIYQFAGIVSDSMVVAFFPVLSKLIKTSKTQLTAVFNFALKYVLFFGLMISIGLWTFSSDIIAVVLGPDFISGVVVLRWFSLVVVASFVNTLLSSFLKATDQQKVDMAIAIAALIANLIISLLLVPRSGMLGSVWAVLISELFACCTRGCVAFGLVRKVAWRRVLFLPALAALVALGFCILIRNISFFFAIPIAGIFMLLLGIPVGLYSSANDLEVSTSRE